MHRSYHEKDLSNINDSVNNENIVIEHYYFLT